MTASTPSTPSSRQYKSFDAANESMPTSGLTTPRGSESGNSRGSGSGRGRLEIFVKRPLGRLLPAWLFSPCFRRAELVNTRRLTIQRKKKKRTRIDASPDDSSDSADDDDDDDHLEPDYRVFRLLALCGITVASGVGNNVTFVKMGVAMPGYPSFLLYFTTLLYCALYVAWLIAQPTASDERRETGITSTTSGAAPSPAAGGAGGAAGDAKKKLFHAGEGTPLLGAQSSPGSGEIRVHISSPSVTAAARMTNKIWTVAHWRKCFKIDWKSPIGALYLWVGFFVTFGGVCSQYANVHVSGTFQALINQVTLPLTALLAYFLRGHKFSSVEIVGACVVCFGSILPIVPQLLGAGSASEHHVHSGGSEMEVVEFNTWLWILIFFASDVPSAAVNIMEEYVFLDYGGDPVHYLAITNILSFFGYILCTPLDLLVDTSKAETRTLWQIQLDGFRCFFGVHVFTDDGEDVGLPYLCRPGAYQPVLAFVVCFCVYFYMLAIVVKHEGAAFQAVVNTLVTPMSTLAFSSTWLMGARDVVAPDTLTITACIIIPIGIIIYKWEDFVRHRDEDILPLIARH
jgi:drug/metabolite transporter (DMT)-like permease